MFHHQSAASHKLKCKSASAQDDIYIYSNSCSCNILIAFNFLNRLEGQTILEISVCINLANAEN